MVTISFGDGPAEEMFEDDEVEAKGKFNIADIYGVSGTSGVRVSLAIYDLSSGWAPILSAFCFCEKIPYFPHTSILAYGLEFWWGEKIQSMNHEEFKKSTNSRPVKIVNLGVTDVSAREFSAFLRLIAPKYSKDTYSLLDNNCNAFSEECSQFLVGKSIPSYVRDAPKKVKKSCTGRLWAFLYALSAATKRACVLAFNIFFATIGLAVLCSTSSSSSSCPVSFEDNSSVRFAIAVFGMECAVSLWSLYGLVHAVRLKKLPQCCCFGNIGLECLLIALLVILEYSASVALSATHTTAHDFLSGLCTGSDGNYDRLGAGVACAWILCVAWPVRAILRACPVMRMHDEEIRNVGGDGRGEFSQIPSRSGGGGADDGGGGSHDEAGGVCV
eukprot:g1478.t1